MSANTRLAVATHIVALLATKAPQFVCSDYIAKSVRTNPVVIRRLVGKLAKAGIIESKLGKCGGARLAQAPEQVTLFDVYQAVDEDAHFSKPPKGENPRCPVSCHMHTAIAEVFERSEQVLERELSRTTIASLIKAIR